MKKTEKLKDLYKKSLALAKEEGVSNLTVKGTQYLYYRKYPHKKNKQYKDVLFVNGCTLPHPERYRVSHQKEQLIAGGLSADSVFYTDLRKEQLKYYRCFIFFRCPITNTIKEFIEQAKHNNKRCIFDVDDLVIDQKYTDEIDFVRQMPRSEKAHYDDGVVRMKETMKLCDFVITSTDRLQKEISKYSKEVFINRNVASDEMVAKSLEALKNVKKDENKIVAGYFSGSITHNENFNVVLPAIVRLMERYKNLYLKVVGILNVPKELELYKDRIINVDFVDWRQLPFEIAECDINLAPLKCTVFNEAKSENKWTEASLVKVVTVASNIGAFKKVIENNKTGLLVEDDDWYKALESLIADKNKRYEIAEAAYKQAHKSHTTVSSSTNLTEILKNNLAKNISFILPSTDISGGVNVVVKHAEILKKHGWDVTLIDANDKKTLKKANKEYNYRFSIPGQNVVLKSNTKIEAFFDTIVATLWSTLPIIKEYPNAKNKLYFVQNYETDFYPYGTGAERLKANASYNDETNVKYITMSLWCKKWLKNDFGKSSKYCSNGIDLDLYEFKKRDFSKKKIQILIEGDSKSEYKNTDEAFKIVEQLDPDKFEISYLSYRKEPKDWYKVDRFYNRIAPEKVGEVYASCDILLKTSLLESFSYPPLEMMATGGISVVVPNDGNIEYLKNNYNCLFYEQGNVQQGIDKITTIINDAELRERIIQNGLLTAKSYKWENIEEDIIKLYE